VGTVIPRVLLPGPKPPHSAGQTPPRQNHCAFGGRYYSLR